MDALRRWQLELGAPFSIYLAADARLSRVSYTDDQVWELTPGVQGSPALTLQTRYGGRANMATIIPMWGHDGQSIYETQTYASPPVLTHFAPAYARVEAKITDSLALVSEYLVIDSRIVTGRFTLTNEGSREEKLHLDLLGQVIANNKELRLAILSLSDSTSALAMGRMLSMAPVLLMENAVADLATIRISPKIGTDLTLAAGQTVYLHWSHAGMDTVESSLEYAQQAMTQDWESSLAQVMDAAQDYPDIQTGDPDIDLTIARSYHALAQAFIDPTDKLPHSPFVATRHPDKGYSEKGDGTDYVRGWNGVSAYATYMTLLAEATINPARAAGGLRNYLATQRDDGWIDAQPGPAGQTSDMMCPPLLARLAWNIFRYTQDEAFLKEVFPALFKFFRRWFQSDLDKTSDGLPEWQDERQMGYTFFPTFSGRGASWAQGVNVRYFETPDLAAHLLSEALSLLSISQQLQDGIAEASLQERIGKLQQLLGKLWYEERYAYRDRDTNAIATHEVLLQDARADEAHPIAAQLAAPARLMIRIVGGTSKVPKATVRIEGKDAGGHIITETANVQEHFNWSYGGGSYTTKHAFAQVDQIACNGLIRIFKVNVTTVDSTRLDINALMPLWSGGIPDDNAKSLIALLSDESHFWQPNGVSLVSAQDSAYDPSSRNGGGGVWSFWTTALGEGLIEYKRIDVATEMVKRLLAVQTAELQQQSHFSEFYHCDEPQGLGEDGHIAGIAPLHLLNRILGIHIASSSDVWIGGEFAWGDTITIKRAGVTVTRQADGSSQVVFPSGHTVDLDADAAWQHITDPQAAPPPETPAPEKSLEVQAPTPSSNRVIINVDEDDVDSQE